MRKITSYEQITLKKTFAIQRKLRKLYKKAVEKAFLDSEGMEEFTFATVNYERSKK